MQHENHINVSKSLSASGSIDPGSDLKPLERLFRVSAPEFVRRHAGRATAVSNGPVERLRPLLKNAHVTDIAVLHRLAIGHSQRIRAAVVGSDGILQYETLRGDSRARITTSRGNWYIFDRLEGHFNAARTMLRQICGAFGYTTLGATCRGFFHGPGASVPRHCDELDAVVLQLLGSRQWCIEPNSDPPVGVWDPVRVPVGGDGRWDADFGDARQVIDLVPGSVLYVPGAWWHQTRSQDYSYSVTLGLPGSAANAVRRQELAED